MMHIFFKFHLSLFLLISSVSLLKAQNTNQFEIEVTEYSSLTLPALAQLFENAKNAPSYGVYEVTEEYERRMLKRERRAWLSFFSLRGSYQYGMFGNDVTYSDVSTPIINSYNTAAQNSYSVGAGINIPLDALFDLNGRIQRQKLNVISAELRKEQRYEEVKKEIIELYAIAVSQLNILKLRAEAVALANMQYRITEKNFANGTINSNELSTEKEKQSITMEKYENCKFELNKSLMILELITYTSILKK